MRTPSFTVFTPTYDRAHVLHRVRDSLAAQTFRDFEWLVVDDGSTDGTRDLVASWAREADFPIRYLWQENAGKAAATNRGVRAARGALFLMADSDDAFVPRAMERLLFHWEAIPAARRDGYVGVTGLCLDAEGRVVGERFPGDPLDSDALELDYRYGIHSEKWGFNRTSVMREFPFPTPPGVRHVPEDVVWKAIARRYRTRYVNEGLRIYFQDAGAQLTRASPRQWVPLRDYWARRLSEDQDYIAAAPGRFFRLAANYARLCFLAGELRPSEQLARVTGTAARALWAAAAAPGALLAARDRLRELARPVAARTAP